MNNRLNLKFVKVITSAFVGSFFLFGCGSDNIGQIDKVVLSPTGVYQVESVQISYGATGGSSCICVERIDDVGRLPKEGDNNSKKCIEISETRSSWGNTYEIDWISDNSFTVISNPNGDYKTFYLVELDGREYQVTEGLTVNQEKTIIKDRSINGDDIEVSCTLFVKNNMSENAEFAVSTFVDTNGYMKGMVRLSSYFEESENLVIGAKEEKAFDVVLRGKKKSDEEFAEFTDSNPAEFYLSITQFQ